MSDSQPVPDTARDRYNTERVCEEVSSHRCIPHGSPQKIMLIGVQMPSEHRHRHRRRRQKHGAESIDEADKAGGAASDQAAAPESVQDPSTRVQFLLGNTEDEETDELDVHPVFCEMDELVKCDSAGDLQWRETARWIKFEEDVEEGGERWSKPHVATLSLFALFEVRNSIYGGEIIFDCEALTMEAVAELITDRLVSGGRLPVEKRHTVFDALMKRHLHLHERRARSGANLGAKIRSFAEMGKKMSSKDLEKDGAGSSMPRIGSSRGDLGEIDPPGSNADLQQHHHQQHHSHHLHAHKYDQHFMKKIPPGAETSNILVGSVDFLDRQLTAFVRLRTAVILGDLTEVPVPTRFVYVLLGPAGQAANYHEMGRSMATLMSDEIFHDVAYLAKTKEDLLSGIDEFLKSCTVLPPNEWDPSIRIEPPKEIPSQEPRKQGSSLATNASGAALGSASNSSVGSPEPAAPGANQLAGSSKKSLLSSSPTPPPQQPAAAASSSPTPPSPESPASPMSPGSGGGGGSGDDHLDPSLHMTGRLFGGLIMDVKKRVPFYLSDFRDAFHLQTLGALFFLYFACLTPIITFGGLLIDATDGHLGAIESLLSGAICGTVYALFSGQPLTILGSTGPVLVFETIVYKMCKDYEWEYLSFRMWVGLWISFILFLFVAFDLSALVKYITRFTEESFAGLIALIFIVEAFKKLLRIENHYPVSTEWQPTYQPNFNCNCFRRLDINDSTWKPLPPGQNLRVPSYPAKPANASGEPRYYANYSAMSYWTWDWYKVNKACTQNQGEWIGEGCGTFAVPDVFFFSCLLFIGTFAISYGLKMMRNSGFFPNFVRSLISDFAVMLAIVLMTVTDGLMGLHTPKLDVPTVFEPTLGYEVRGWLITPFGRRGQNAWYTVLLALFPALLATILIFMDQQITAVIVNRKENRLKKGLGYHLDLLVVALLIGINSVLGIPWFVAATVLSINHVMSLKIESESIAPGERPKFLGCRENRVTGFTIFLLIGLSVFMTPVLRNIPMPVLYGVFLFMGVSSLNGIQLVQRIGLFFMPQKYQPDYIFLRHVKLTQVHKFTIIQVLCLVLLWVVKAIKQVSILFPIMVLAMCFVRKALDYLFEQSELKWLDDIMPPIEFRRKPNSAATGSAATNQRPVTVEFPMGASADPKLGEAPFNVSVELGQTSIWRNLTAGSETDDKKKAKGRDTADKHRRRSPPKTAANAADPADQEAQQRLLNAPSIVVQPPSGSNTPERRDSNA